MLARISGILESVEGSRALILLPGSREGTGVAYEVLVPGSLAGDLLMRVGEPLTLHTIESFEGQGQGTTLTARLIGFASRSDRRFFEVFTTVKGVGARKALRAMAAPTGRIARAIVDRDTKFLQTLPEIGKRMAETIVAELSGKVDDFAAAPAGSAVESGAGVRAVAGNGTAGGAGVERAVAALMRLGESRMEAERMVRRAVEVEPKLSTADEILAAAFASRGA